MSEWKPDDLSRTLVGASRQHASANNMQTAQLLDDASQMIDELSSERDHYRAREAELIDANEALSRRVGTANVEAEKLHAKVYELEQIIDAHMGGRWSGNVLTEEDYI